MEQTEEWRIQALNTETQQMLKTALTDPGMVDLVKLCDLIVDQALKDSSLCRDAGHICCTLVQVEAKRSSTSVFRRNMLTRLQQEFTRREETRRRSLHEWVCVVSLLCNVFDRLKVNNSPMAALVDPVYDCLFRLAQPDALVNEVECVCVCVGGLLGSAATPRWRAAGEAEHQADGRALLPAARRFPPAGRSELHEPPAAAGAAGVPRRQLEPEQKRSTLLLQRGGGVRKTRNVALNEIFLRVKVRTEEGGRRTRSSRGSSCRLDWMEM
ncbi:MIF4G domain-containing protein A isoform X1 [Pangasianodon hypophthalmus]|uniref:MIF4G domain-containing protein A isoform X1 n=1 Tax=Pangasianodon hypophthalmus TaxID=310915 RepID=UPI0023076E0F|nr:MIF4G domain-containing protein A isoform X1 [Pangasianodon hypophthalmus]XP_053088190.1 MIF4G domain-containing protein A isoform X1 [Pangasianodon hypophthalmus]